ncbi:hypothetical protein H5410_050197 [Solanum commersonii]|uniref:SWIM-type domain-containing protein n=1 Tax=Solanum commersonii TaxID=4109 RepID=A0A9J5WUV7_SOLCO|nr:hypothetical protein H5410_050197 [Solanum commersonii]
MYEMCFMVIPSTLYLHVVVDGLKRHIVCINTKKCSYGKFQNDEIPCGHGMAVLSAYVIPVEPFPCESTWDIPSYVSKHKLMLHGSKRTVGRPQLERWKGFVDVKFKRSKVTCSRCCQVGHNRKTCSNYPVPKKMITHVLF